MIGVLGDIVFEVSSNNIFTFKNLKRSASAKWSEQSLINKKPISQYSSPALEQITFSITISNKTNKNIREDIEMLRDMAEGDKVYPCLIGGKPISSSLYQRVVSINDTWDVISSSGELLSSTVSITLKDYE